MESAASLSLLSQLSMSNEPATASAMPVAGGTLPSEVRKKTCTPLGPDSANMNQQPVLKMAQCSSTSVDALSPLQLDTTTPIVPLAKGSFPLEVRLKILDYLTDSRIVTIAKLMLVNREWYATVEADQLGFERRTARLAGEHLDSLLRLQGFSSKDDQNWYHSWVNVYSAHCFDCKRALRKEDYRLYFGNGIFRHPGEPKKALACTDCHEKASLYDVLSEGVIRAWPWRLDSSEVVNLYAGRQGKDRTYLADDINALRYQKEPKRKAEILELVNRLSSPERSSYETALANRYGQRSAKSIVRPLGDMEASANPPTMAQVRAIATLHDEWMVVPNVLKQRLLDSAITEFTFDQAFASLHYGTHFRRGEKPGDYQYGHWRDELAQGRTTYEAFFEYLKGQYRRLAEEDLSRYQGRPEQLIKGWAFDHNFW